MEEMTDERTVTALFEARIKRGRPKLIDDDFKRRHKIRTTDETIKSILEYTERRRDYIPEPADRRIRNIATAWWYRTYAEKTYFSSYGLLSDINLLRNSELADLSFPRQSVFAIGDVLTLSFLAAMRGYRASRGYALAYTETFGNDFLVCFPELPFESKLFTPKLIEDVLDFISLDESPAYFIEHFKFLRSKAAEPLQCEDELASLRREGQSIQNQPIPEPGLAELLSNASIKDGVVMADPALTTAANMSLILKRKAHYLMPLKDECGHLQLIESLDQAFKKAGRDKSICSYYEEDLPASSGSSYGLQIIEAHAFLPPDQIAGFPSLNTLVRYYGPAPSGKLSFNLFFLSSLPFASGREESKALLAKITGALLSRWDPSATALGTGRLDPRPLRQDPKRPAGTGRYTDSFACDHAVSWYRRYLTLKEGLAEPLGYTAVMDRLNQDFYRLHRRFIDYWLEGMNLLDLGPQGKRQQ